MIHRLSHLLIVLVSFSLFAIEKVEPLKPSENRVGRLISDLAYTTASGQSAKLSALQSHKATVIALFKHNCPLSRKFAPSLAALIKEYKSKDVGFLLVNVSQNATASFLQQELQKYGLGSEIALDPHNEISKALFAQSTTETFVLDSARTLVYRGPIHDQHSLLGSLPAPRRHYLREAIESTLNETPVAEKALVSPGCLLGLSKTTENLSQNTYYNRISRIVQHNCQSCHRPGEAGPFSLLTYADVRDHAVMAKFMIEQRLMPPWFASAQHGKWKNDRSLTAEDKAAFVDWVNRRMPIGDPTDKPLAMNWTEGWNIGTPDAILTPQKTFSIPAEGVLPYQYVPVRHSFTQDKWIKAIELRAQSPEVVHHILVVIRYPKGHPLHQTKPNNFSSFFAALVPGQSVVRFPKGLGKRLPKDAYLLFQIHYTPNGVATEDKPSLGLVFSDAPPKHEVKSLSAYNKDFTIPAHDPNYKVEASLRFDKRTRLLSFMPHMHLRGKAFKYELVLPDGSTKTLLDVPRYDFNWQLRYELGEPLDVPPGSVLKATAWYDNSESNPFNPDPSIEVGYGEQTFEEMMFGFFEYHTLAEN